MPDTPTSYPDNEYQDGALLLDLLGSYWSAAYAGNPVLRGYTTGVGLLEAQTFANALELVDALAVDTVPVFHKENWRPLRLRASERQAAELLRYGDAAVYGSQPDGYTYAYGVSRTDATAFPAPATLSRAPVLCNNLTRPTAVLAAGTDFDLTADGLLVFRKDPFADPRLPQRPVYDASGATVDSEIVLWLFRADFDLEMAYARYGYVLDLRLRSSVDYRDLLATLFASLVEGPGALKLRTALALMCSTPLARTTGEIVEDIALTATRLLIVTDRDVYQFDPDALPIVAVGDTLEAGDSLVHTFAVTPLSNGVVPASVASLSAGSGLLIGAYTGELSFLNRDLPTTVTTAADGRTVLTFPVGGSAPDVAAFWADVHARGVAAGATLAELLDTRTNKVGQPTAAALPASVNPLQLLAGGLLRNAVLIELDAAAVPTAALGIQPTVLRRLLPPQYTAIILINLTAAPEAVTVVAGGTPTATGVSEACTFFTATETLSEPVTAGDVTATAVTMSLVAD